MDNNYENYVQPSYEDAVRAQSAFINRVYSWMSVGLAITGCIAWYFGTQKIDFIIKNGGMLLPLIVVEVLVVMALSWMINKINSFVASALFFIYAALNGVTMSWIFLAYELGSVANVFFITCATFGGMSVYGYVTKRDLTTIGSICGMALWGLIIAGIINIFWHNDMAQFVISCIGVLVFVGLTAYDTQKIKQLAIGIADGEYDGETAKKAAVIGALQLYLDFVNLFLYLLRLFGRRR